MDVDVHDHLSAPVFRAIADTGSTGLIGSVVYGLATTTTDPIFYLYIAGGVYLVGKLGEVIVSTYKGIIAARQGTAAAERDDCLAREREWKARLDRFEADMTAAHRENRVLVESNQLLVSRIAALTQMVAGANMHLARSVAARPESGTLSVRVDADESDPIPVKPVGGAAPGGVS